MTGGAFPLLCCDSRLVHRTAGLSRASADPDAADAGSVRKRNFSLRVKTKYKCAFHVVEQQLTRWPSSSLRSTALVRVPVEPGTSSCSFSFVSSAQAGRTRKSTTINIILTSTHHQSSASVILRLALCLGEQFSATLVELSVQSANFCVSSEALRTPRPLRVSMWHWHGDRSSFLPFFQGSGQSFDFLISLLKGTDEKKNN